MDSHCQSTGLSQLHSGVKYSQLSAVRALSSMNTDSVSPIRQKRIEFSKSLVEWESQRSWYDAKAVQFKTRAQWLDLFVLVCGSLVAALPVLKPGGDIHWTEVLVSFLGAGVVLGQGLLRVFRYDELWPEYRMASERMKREWRLFVSSSGRYDVADDVAQAEYIAALDSIVAKENKTFINTVSTKSGEK